jgi:hypothetical protein
MYSPSAPATSRLSISADHERIDGRRGGYDECDRAGTDLEAVMTVTTTLRRALPVVALAVALVYGWLLSGTRPFTTSAAVTTAIPVALGLAVALVRRGQRQRFRAWRAESRDAYERSLRPATRPRVAAGVAAWTVVIALIAAWELFNLFQLPRDDHPRLAHQHRPRPLVPGARLGLARMALVRQVTGGRRRPPAARSQGRARRWPSRAPHRRSPG